MSCDYIGMSCSISGGFFVFVLFLVIFLLFLLFLFFYLLNSLM